MKVLFAAPAVAAVGALWLKFNEDKDLRWPLMGAKALNCCSQSTC